MRTDYTLDPYNMRRNLRLRPGLILARLAVLLGFALLVSYGGLRLMLALLQ